jgi:hypothetical protein
MSRRGGDDKRGWKRRAVSGCTLSWWWFSRDWREGCGNFNLYHELDHCASSNLRTFSRQVFSFVVGGQLRNAQQQGREYHSPSFTATHPMNTLPPTLRIAHAAAALDSPYGAVTRPAARAGISRQALSRDAHRVVQVVDGSAYRPQLRAAALLGRADVASRRCIVSWVCRCPQGIGRSCCGCRPSSSVHNCPHQGLPPEKVPKRTYGSSP